MVLRFRDAPLGLGNGWYATGERRGGNGGFRVGLIPRPHYTTEDTWFVVGMRGSGSNAIVADDVFIPDHRIIPVSKAIVGDFSTEFEDEVLYHSAFVSALTVVLAGPQLGLGRAALRLAIEQASKRSVPNTIYVKQSDSVGFQTQIAEAAMLIDAAHLHASGGGGYR